MSEQQNWIERGRGVWTLRVEPDAVTIGLIAGDDGCLLVDTGSSPAQGAEIRAQITEVTDRPLRHVVVTHRHRDHWFGLAAFDDVETIGHETLAERRPYDLEDAGALGVAEDDLRTPDVTFGTVIGRDLGRRWVEIAHLGPGHTDGDVIVTVGDARLLFAGDLLESAGPPQFGLDSVPARWAATGDQLVGLTMKGQWTTLPGHGEPMSPMDVMEQCARLGGIEVECRRLIESGVPVERALAEGSWPFPAEGLGTAVSGMYEHLASIGIRPQRTLPIKPL